MYNTMETSHNSLWNCEFQYRHHSTKSFPALLDPFFLNTFFLSVSTTNLARACGANQQQACPTIQSSLFKAFAASLANDGSLTTGHSHTDGAPGLCGVGIDKMTPWWMVDFGYTTSIGGGKLWGRTAVGCALGCLSRLDGFKIWVGDSSSAYNATGNRNCYTAKTTEHRVSPFTHAFDCAANGRYFFIVLTNGKCLSMREIEIYRLGENFFSPC